MYVHMIDGAKPKAFFQKHSGKFPNLARFADLLYGIYLPRRRLRSQTFLMLRNRLVEEVQSVRCKIGAEQSFLIIKLYDAAKDWSFTGQESRNKENSLLKKYG